ncbi:TPA: DUF1796 family putative cysteine peptidase [Klebsiella variicola subsp. variicola]
MCSLKKHEDLVWISLGENCLSDDILKRHYKKSYSSLYAAGRSNIEYALDMDKNNYKDLLSKVNLEYAYVGSHRVVRSIIYKSSSPNYNNLHLNGFEFTHHNPIENVEHKKSFNRRIKRMIEGKGRKNYVFLYHHRSCENQDLNRIRENLIKFKEQYQINNKKCFVIFFYQTAICNRQKRGIYNISNSNNILEFQFVTERIWSGNDDDLFWARVDDDLIKIMIKKSETFISSIIKN